MSRVPPKTALEEPSVVRELVRTEEIPVIAAKGLTREQQALAAAWLGVPLGPLLEQQGEGSPLVLASTRSAEEAAHLQARLEGKGLPAHLEDRLVAARGSPTFTFLLTAILASPLLVVTGLIELIGLATPVGLIAQALALGAALLYLGLVVWLPVRKSRNKARRAVYNAPLQALDAKLQRLSVADPEAGALRDRALRLRRAVIDVDLSHNARDDLLSGLEEVLVSLEELGLERAKVNQALHSDSASRIRGKVRQVGEPTPETALASALADLEALEQHRGSLSRAITHVDHELDALEMALARLDTSDEMRTEAELAGLIARTREARQASEELISARVPVLPRTRTMS
ncbi:MAG: hypothetical protein H6740_17725 [Alphaproteobacteria bacterium]|nr:hypothetical protein [Alphaproteobacteria bacterium]